MYSQPFDTGDAGSGYDLGSIVLKFSSTGNGGTVTVTVREDSSGNPSSTALYTLRNPDSLAAGLNTFTAPDDATLGANKTYHVVLGYSGNSFLGQTSPFWSRTLLSNGIDSGAASGWNIDARPRSAIGSSAWSEISSATAFQIQVRGSSINSAPTVATAIPDQSATAGAAFSYAFPENAFADSDSGDTLTYTAASVAGDGTVSSLPSWLSFDAGTRAFSGTPRSSDVGTVTVRVTASDGSESVSDEFVVLVRDATGPTPATGEPTITGTPQIGFTLAAHRGDIDDVNGAPARFPTGYDFQWVRVDDTTETDIDMATGRTYTLTADDEGRQVKVRVSFTDDLASRESRTSTAYPSNAVIAMPPYPTPPRWVHAEGSGTAAIALTWAPPESTWGWSVQGYEYRVRLVPPLDPDKENNWQSPTNAAELVHWPAIDTGWVTVPDSADRGGGAGNEQRVVIEKLTASDTELTANADYYIQLRARTGGPRPVSVSLWDGANGGIVQIRATAGGSAAPWLPIVYVPEDRDYITLTAQDLGGGDFRMLTVWSTPTRETGRVFYGGVPEFGIFGVPREHIDRGHLKFQPRENFGGEGAQMLLTTDDDALDRDHWRMLRLEVQRTGTQTPVCARTKAVRDAIVRTLGHRDCGNVGHVELKSIAQLTYANGFALSTSSLAPGDFDGLTGLESLSITLADATVTRLPTGLFSGLRSLETLAINGDGKAGGLTVLQDGLLQGLESLTDFAIQNHADLAALGDRLLRDTPNLEDISLSLLPALGELPAGLLHGLTDLKGVFIVSLNTLTAIPEGFFRDNPGLTTFDLLSNAALVTVPGDLFANTPEVTAVDLSETDGLTAFPDRFFEPLTMLETLELEGTPSTLSADTAMDADIDPQDVSGTVSTVIALDGSPQSTSPWGANLLWEWTQVASCPDGAEVTTDPVALAGADTRTPSFTAGASAATLYFQVTAKPPGERDLDNLTPYDFSTTDCITVTITAAMSGQVAAPSVSSVSVTAAPGEDNSWDADDAVEAVLTFDENVTVDTTNGTPSVVVKLGEDETEKTADYASGSGTAALTFRYTVATGEGPYSEVSLEGNSLELNGGTIQSTATQADASLAHNGAGQAYPRSIVPDSKNTQKDAGPTAAFSNVPATHDGETAFTVELAFSAESSITSYATVRDSLLEVAGATVTRARRKTRGSNTAWVLTVRPSGSGDATLTLPVRPCGAANAVCVGGKPIVRAATATIEGPPFSASFVGAPSEHDGSAFTANLRISAEPESLSYVTVRDRLFAVTGATVTRARRLVRGKSRDWALTVRPSGFGPVMLSLVPTTDCDTAPGVCDASGRTLSGPLSLTVAGPPTLSVADAAVDEAEGATLDFQVTLSEALDSAVTVAYATSDNTAAAGSDYTAVSGTLTFAAGETQKTVSVAVLDDAHDEGSETLTLTLSDPSPARVKLEDAQATGTIRNTDAMPKAWTARFGRTVAEQVLDTVEGRIRAPRLPGAQASLAGRRIGWRPDSAGTLAAGDGLPPVGADRSAALSSGTQDQAAGVSDWLRGSAGSRAVPGSPSGAERAGSLRTIAAHDLLLGSSFDVTAEAGGPGSGRGTVSVWGRGAVSRFDGREDELNVDGEVTSTMLGADWSWGPGSGSGTSGAGRTLAGLIVGHSTGEGGYRAPSGSGTVSSTLTGLYPWGRHALTDRIEVWGAAGYGEGTFTLEPDGEDAIRTDLDLRMAAAGLRGVLVDPGSGSAGASSGAGGGLRDRFTLTAKTDAMIAQTSTTAVAGELAASEAGVTRLRLGLEGALPVAFGDGSVLTPSMELGVRHDGGDAETGFGADLGGGIAWSDPKRGLDAEIRGRGLLTHESKGFRERGFSGTLGWNPGEGGRGPSFSLTRTIGGTSSGGADALLQRGTMEGLAANEEGGDDLEARRLEARFGYGFAAFGGGFTFTPEVGVGRSDTGRGLPPGLAAGASRAWRAPSRCRAGALLRCHPARERGQFRIGVRGRLARARDRPAADLAVLMAASEAPSEAAMAHITAGPDRPTAPDGRDRRLCSRCRGRGPIRVAGKGEREGGGRRSTKAS